ncbi:hypothetical protein AVEN_15681-1 [Araneus ventricosus]|uniref:Uncharacterized protein n=1 Tax=Araneus ventricosus TaxID=182803 RepID=A0A4Y2GQG3_ARAVE|nr:hypothetical protein AVEN_15681-1 [Araneus ventricosus]
MGSIINDCSKTVLEMCEKRSEEGKPVDCKGLFGAFTMDVIANSAFGTQIDSQNDPNNEFVTRVRRVFEGFNFTTMLLAFALPVWIWKFLPSSFHPLKFDRDDFFRDVTRNVIKKRKETGRVCNIFRLIFA